MHGQPVACKGPGGGGPSFRRLCRVTRWTCPSPPDCLMKPQGSSEHCPTGPSASLETWARCRSTHDTIPQSRWHGRGWSHTTATAMPPASMGGTWHLKTFEAPEVPTDKGDCMTLVGLQAETRGLSIRRSLTACRLNLGPFGLREPALLQVPPLLGSTCHGQRVGPVCCGAVATARSSAARGGARR